MAGDYRHGPGTTTLNRTLDRPAAMAGADVTMHLVEHQLMDGLERVLRSVSKPGWALLLLHLSRVGAAGPRPYHRRTMAALLDDTAERCAGQLFALGNGDIAMLFRPPDDGVAVLTLIARMFQADGIDLDTLRSLWPLPSAAVEARRHIQRRIAEHVARPELPRNMPDLAPDPTDDRLNHARIRAAALPQLVFRQTAVRLRPGTARRITPIFREIGITPAGIASVAAEDRDPLPPSAVTAQVDRRVLAAAVMELAQGGRMTGRPIPSGPITGAAGAQIHLNLTLAAVMSEPFARFAAALDPAASARIRIELPYHEVFADPVTFILARERLRLAGMPMVLDQVTHHAFLLSRPEVARPALLKLGWSPAMVRAGPALPTAMRRFGVESLVLADCGTEAAVAWGLGLGLQQFQGEFVDTMLAAERLRGCVVGQGCTMVACRTRAATLDPTIRSGCRNHSLLDASFAQGSA